jgi:DNA-binding LytR/AlgR family response regulator
MHQEEENMMIKCLIVDDEPPAQRVLENYVSKIPFLELAGKCVNVFEASAFLRQQTIDLIFLDINMPKMSGLEFLRTLKNRPDIIITTAYREYALEGFELNVTDYLQKPFSFERFFMAINKVLTINKNATTNPTGSVNADNIKEGNFVFLREEKINYKVNLNEIQYLESVGDYVKVHTDSKTYLVYQTLKKFEKLFNPKSFIRVHKSFIIAFSKISYIEGNTIFIGNQNIPVGTTFRKTFFESLEKFKLK